MCGIVGVWDLAKKHSREELQKIINAMALKLQHRGPNDQGLWFDSSEGVALGHRRLSIIDTSAMGHQPMSSSSKRYHISYNGEIYNFLDLKKELEKVCVQVWRGHSDTEVLLRAIETWGIEKTLYKIKGMFAIILWDAKEKHLHLLRDRFGEKPLYYGWCNSLFVVTSELKTLKAIPNWQDEIDVNAVSLYMQYGYIPAPYSIYKNIYKLPQGQHLLLNKAKDIKINSFWEIPKYTLKKYDEGNEQDIIDNLENTLINTIQQQMVSDVPLGAFLSGGIDSSLVVALMQAYTHSKVQTFTIGFDNKKYDESIFAKDVAGHLGTDHTELILSPEAVIESIGHLPLIYDEPFSDSSQIPTYLVSRLAKSRVSVCLSGDGADELFGGYNRYQWVPYFWNKTKFFPMSLKKILSGSIQRLSPHSWDRVAEKLNICLPKKFVHRQSGDKLYKVAKLLPKSSEQAMFHALLNQWENMSDIMSIDFQYANEIALNKMKKEVNNLSIQEQMMLLDAYSYLPDDILVKVDRAAMAVSLETRAPYLDKDVAELAAQFPMRSKIRGNTSKWVLREILYKYVPKHLVERPKMGFGIPLDEWLRGPLKTWANILLDKNKLKQQGFLKPDEVHKKWSEHLLGRRNWLPQLWGILMFQSWLDANAS